MDPAAGLSVPRTLQDAQHQHNNMQPPGSLTNLQANAAGSTGQMPSNHAENGQGTRQYPQGQGNNSAAQGTGTVELGYRQLAAMFATMMSAVAGNATSEPFLSTLAAMIPNIAQSSAAQMASSTNAAPRAAPTTAVGNTQADSTAMRFGLERIAEAEDAAKAAIANNLDRLRDTYRVYKTTEQKCARITQLVETGGILKTAAPRIPEIATTEQTVNAKAQAELNAMYEQFGRQVTAHILKSQIEARELQQARFHAEVEAAMSQAVTCITDLGALEPFQVSTDLTAKMQFVAADIQQYARMHIAADVMMELDKEFKNNVRKPLVTGWKQPAGEPSTDTPMPDSEPAETTSRVHEDADARVLKKVGALIDSAVQKALGEHNKQQRKQTARTTTSPPARSRSRRRDDSRQNTPAKQRPDKQQHHRQQQRNTPKKVQLPDDTPTRTHTIGQASKNGQADGRGGGGTRKNKNVRQTLNHPPNVGSLQLQQQRVQQ
jgi:hypothetical protein